VVDIPSLVESFRQMYGAQPRVFSAPGRVNLIGEHTDYNDGFVLPMAINRRTYVAAAIRRDRQIRLHSLTLQEHATFSLDHFRKVEQTSWANYVAGVAFVLQQQRRKLLGLDMALDSDVPIGGGLSSSAALEISAGIAFLKLADENIDPQDLALAAQKAEHDYVGTRIGIMDQLTAATAEKDHAVLIDCRSLEDRMIPMKLEHASVVVCNTNVKHKLASSEYNQRRAECEWGVEILQRTLPTVRSLRDVSITDFEKYRSRLPDPINRRCRHVITENDRTLRAAEALERIDLAKFGDLMRESHRSLRDDYEVSSPELDTMVGIATKHSACIGARMTGGGFGGCTVNLVRREGLEDFRQSIEREYFDATAVNPDIYIVEADRGMNEIKL
jgi:galactokinase